MPVRDLPVTAALVLLLTGCTSGGGAEAEESPSVSANRAACNALGRADGRRGGLVGFAGMAADGQASTTGGKGGTVHLISSYADLVTLLDDGNNSAPKIIEILGILSPPGGDSVILNVGSNTTLAGVGAEPTIQGFGFRMAGVQNISVTNLDFIGGDNALRITQGSHHVWVHHNAFRGYEDNAVEVREGASYITVAWNHFQNQNRVLLAGHSDDNGGQDVGRLKLTVHHNWFDATTQRHPLVRFGEAHVFNNYFDDLDIYGVGSTLEAEVLVQGNYFRGTPVSTSRGPTATLTLDEGDLVECDNIYIDSGDPETRGAAFDPSDYYSYALDDAKDVPRLVKAGAGPRVIAPSVDQNSPIEEPSVLPPPLVDEQRSRPGAVLPSGDEIEDGVLEDSVQDVPGDNAGF
jgi:pectate lyase